MLKQKVRVEILSVATRITVFLLIYGLHVSLGDDCPSGYYGYKCKSKCSDNCGGDDSLCDSVSGNCTSGCDEGYYGPRCRTPCSPFCAKNTTCDENTGHCLSGCEDDWFRPKCDTNCDPQWNVENCKFCMPNTTECLICFSTFYLLKDSNKCLPCSNCLNSECNSHTGVCKYGCKKGWMPGVNYTCNEPCNENCIDNDCTASGWCSKGCANRTYTRDCSKPCPGMCVGNTCYMYDGDCRNGCEEGYMGRKCQYSCDHCLSDACNPNTTRCDACKKEWYGWYCHKRCSGCIDGVCSPGKGCANGCIPERHGPYCDIKCKDNCFACAQHSGECKLCKSNFTGPDCTEICDNCTNPYENDTATLNKGMCNPGKYGSSCSEDCSENCGTINGESMGRCYKYTGICLNGCQAGHYGEFCQNRCGNCSGVTCHVASGECSSRECMKGYFGKKCMTKCKPNCEDNTCYFYTGGCTYGCKEPYSGIDCDDIVEEGMSSGALIAIVICTIVGSSIIITVIIQVFKSRRKRKAKSKGIPLSQQVAL